MEIIKAYKFESLREYTMYIACINDDYIGIYLDGNNINWNMTYHIYILNTKVILHPINLIAKIDVEKLSIQNHQIDIINFHNEKDEIIIQAITLHKRLKKIKSLA